MSTEPFPQERPQSLHLQIPSSSDGCSTSSAASSSQTSPTGILDTTPSTRTSTSSFRSPSIQFAPLPEIAPRKRKSSAPLGMAARRQLAERRRQRLQHMMNENPMWTNEEIEQHARRASSGGGRGGEYSEDDDPFLVLGKLMKDAGKQLWKKVSNKELKSKSQDDTEVPPVPPVPSVPSASTTISTAATTTTATTLDEPIPLTQSPTEEQSTESWTVLETTIPQIDGETDLSEKKEDDYDPKLGTQTIVEGHTKYSWVRGKADELATAISTQAQKMEIPPLPFEVSKSSFQSL